MILILANNEDSLIYLRNMLRSAENIRVNSRLYADKGKIYGQDVVIACTNYSNYNSAIVTSALIETFSPYVVIMIGDCLQLTSNNLSVGDIVVGNYCRFCDVDQTNRDPQLMLNVVPGFPKHFSTETEVISAYLKAASEVGVLNAKTVAFITGNNSYVNSFDIPFDYKGLSVKRNSDVVYDTEMGGVCLACNFADIPLFPLASVSASIDNKKSLIERKRTILKTAVNIGKIVVAFIVSISNDEATFNRNGEFDNIAK